MNRIFSAALVVLILGACSINISDSERSENRSENGGGNYINACGYAFEVETDENVIQTEKALLSATWISTNSGFTVANGASVKYGYRFDVFGERFLPVTFKYVDLFNPVPNEIVEATHKYDEIRIGKLLDWAGHDGFRVLEFHRKNEAPSWKTCSTHVYRYKHTQTPGPLTLLPSQTAYIVGNGSKTPIANYLSNYPTPEASGYMYKVYSR